MRRRRRRAPGRARVVGSPERPIVGAAEPEPETADTNAPSQEGGDTLTRPSDVRFWWEQDLLVVVGALALLAAASFVVRGMSQPEKTSFDYLGLTFERPSGWLPPEQVTARQSALGAGLATIAEPALPPDAGVPDAGPPPKRKNRNAAPPDAGPPPPPPPPEPKKLNFEFPYHVIFQSVDAQTRIEVNISRRPIYGNLSGALTLDRIGQFGDAYWSEGSAVKNVGGRDWTRTVFRYPYKASPMDSPSIAHAVEYATLNGPALYVVRFHGTEETSAALEAFVAETLSVRADDRIDELDL